MRGAKATHINMGGHVRGKSNTLTWGVMGGAKATHINTEHYSPIGSMQFFFEIARGQLFKLYSSDCLGLVKVSHDD